MYYRVIPSLRDIPPLDNHEFGYENTFDFQQALSTLVQRYGGMVGKCVGVRHDFYQLIFSSPINPGAKIWIPRALCRPSPPLVIINDEDEDDPLADVLDEGW